MSLELNANDRHLLTSHRLERLRSFFGATLRKCHLELNRGQLHIHCSEPWIVDELLSEMNELRSYTQIIVGVSSISLYFAAEKVYRTPARKRQKKGKRQQTATVSY